MLADLNHCRSVTCSLAGQNSLPLRGITSRSLSCIHAGLLCHASFYSCLHGSHNESPRNGGGKPQIMAALSESPNLLYPPPHLRQKLLQATCLPAASREILGKNGSRKLLVGHEQNAIWLVFFYRSRGGIFTILKRILDCTPDVQEGGEIAEDLFSLQNVTPPHHTQHIRIAHTIRLHSSTKKNSNRKKNMFIISTITLAGDKNLPKHFIYSRLHTQMQQNDST